MAAKEQTFAEKTLGAAAVAQKDEDALGSKGFTQGQGMSPENTQECLFVNSTPFTGSYKEALKLATTAMEKGDERFGEGDYDNAFLEYTKALYYWPTNLYGFLNRAKTCAKLKLHDQAIADAYHICALVYSIIGFLCECTDDAPYEFPDDLSNVDWSLSLGEPAAPTTEDKSPVLPLLLEGSDETMADKLENILQVYAKALLFAASSYSAVGEFRCAVNTTGKAGRILTAFALSQASSFKLLETAKISFEHYSLKLAQSKIEDNEAEIKLARGRCYVNSPLNGCLEKAVAPFREPERLNERFFQSHKFVEVRQVTHGGKQMLGVFARRDLHPGQVVIREVPIMVCSSGVKPRCDTCGIIVDLGARDGKMMSPRSCPTCNLHFCNQMCQEKADATWHPVLCAPASTIGSYAWACELALHRGTSTSSLQTPATLKTIALAVAQGCNPLLLPDFAHLVFAISTYKDYRWIWKPSFELGLSWLAGSAQSSKGENHKHLSPHFLAHSLSYFSVNAAAGRVMKNSFGNVETLRDGNRKPDTLYMLPRTSLVNHSCRPNCSQEGKELTVRRRIRKGEELFISYVDISSKENMRVHRMRLGMYNVDCNC